MKKGIINKISVGANVVRPRYKGITLISLVITIVIMLILAGVGIYGSLTLIEEAKYSAFINEMKQLDESVAILIMEKQIESAETGKEIQLFEELADINSLPVSLQNEIKYIRAKQSGIDMSAKIPSDYTGVKLKTGKEGSNIYYIDYDIAGGKEKAYIYDEQSASAYKIEPTIIWGVELHGYEYGNLLVTQSGLLQRAQKNEGEFDIHINNIDDFVAFRSNVNSGTTYEGEKISLNTDIDLSNICGVGIENWTPIGSETTPFKGTFEGNEYKIENLYISTTGNNQGLFGYIDNGNIENLTVQGNVTSSSNTGLIGGYMLNNSKISNCIAKGTVQSTTQRAGGIIGLSQNSIVEYCINYANITSVDGAGGIVGVESFDYSTVQYCVNYGTVSAVMQAGGICGVANQNSSIKYCYNIADVSTTSDYGAGGIVATFGHNSLGSTGTLEGCYNIGKIKGYIRFVGGIAGMAGRIEIVRNIVNCGDVYLSTTKATKDIGVTSTSVNNTTSTLGRIIGFNLNEQILNYKYVTSTEFQSYTEAMIQSALGEEYTVDVQNEDGTWKYNEGFPILKWQLEE